MTVHDAIFDQLPASGEAIPFNHLADKLEDLSPDAVIAGLRVLQTEGRAAIAYGFGWHRLGVELEENAPDTDSAAEPETHLTQAFNPTVIALAILPAESSVQYFESGDGPMGDPIIFRVGELLEMLEKAASAGYAANSVPGQVDELVRGYDKLIVDRAGLSFREVHTPSIHEPYDDAIYTFAHEVANVLRKDPS